MKAVERVQYRFGRMQDEAQNRGAIWDTRFFKGEMRDEDRKARPGHTPIRRRDRGWDGYRRAHKKYFFALETGLINAPV